MSPRLSFASLAAPLALGLAVAACNQASGAPAAAPRAAPRTLAACPSASAREAPAFPRSPGGTPEVDPAWLAAHRCGVRMIDVREPDEYTGSLGHIEGSTLVPLATLEQAAASWPRDEALVLVCRSGRRSERAVEALQALGFRATASLTGGMLAWNAEGLPTVRTAPSLPRLSAAAPGARDEPLAVTPAGPLTAASLRERLARPDAVVWTTAAALLTSNTESCVDGRATGPVLGAPGGDVGELLLALASYERAAGAPLELAHIDALLEAYTRSFGTLYLHTDAHALERLAASLRGDPHAGPALAAFERRALEAPPGEAPEARALRLARAFVLRPPEQPAVEAALLAALTRPAHVGCGHLRRALERPVEYGLRPALAEAVLRAVFRAAWARPERLDFVVLEGDHAERAVLEVRLAHPVHAHSRVPMLAPHPSNQLAELFVAHPQVAAFVREESASFLLEHAALLGLRAPSEGALRAALGELGAQQERATLGALAAGLPRYVALFDEQGLRELRAAP